MTGIVRNARRTEFGDFQTPLGLARAVCRRIRERGLRPASVIEPTCGRGSFLRAAAEAFPSVRQIVGFEINEQYVGAARQELATFYSGDARIECRDFFQCDWNSLLQGLPKPILLIGNPPWVTSATVGALRGANLPEKSNFQQFKGLDALTGKSNFDISEWMLVQLLTAMHGSTGHLAMLCKTAVARKVLAYAWRNGIAGESEICAIDANAHFNASVDACLLDCSIDGKSSSPSAAMYLQLDDRTPASTIGMRDDTLIADLKAWEETSELAGASPYVWRSGVKHDCAKLMEMVPLGRGYQNGLGEFVELEEDCLFPMLKSSEVASGNVAAPRRRMLITQSYVGEDTESLRERAPLTWSYLERHADRFGRRASSIYRGRPPFSIFGVGPYSFSQYKVAISGLYKRLQFQIVPPANGRPVVFDDTCTFVSCESEHEAVLVRRLLMSTPAQRFLAARIFWDAKRPITAQILNQLDLRALARRLNEECPEPGSSSQIASAGGMRQSSLF